MHNKNIKFKKYRIPFISSLIGIGGIFLFSYLTFIPAQTFAESLIVDPNEKRSLSGISTMQEMSQQICINSRENETKQLTDTRDQKKYWVTKLKDGNCWMTQNLDFDLDNKILTSQDSNVLSIIDTSNITVNEVPNIQSPYSITKNDSPGNWSSSDDNYKAYYNPGEYYYITHSQNSSGCHTTTGLSDCKGFSDSVGIETEKHYSLGNYYSFSAATLGSLDDKEAGEAAQDICPRGWRLPTGSADTGELHKLMLAYGWTNPLDTTLADALNNNNGVYGNPLYFVYGGYLDNNQLTWAEKQGHYWSSTPENKSRAQYFLFDNRIRPYVSAPRYSGYSIRCIARNGHLLDPNQSNLTITVTPTISLDVTADAIMEDATFTKVSTSNIIANVSSNYQYTVSLSTNQSNLELATPVSGQNIPMIKAGENVVAGTNGWGIMQKMSALDNTMLGSTVDNINNTYSPVGIGDEQIVFYKSAGPEALTDQTNPANPLTLKVGVGISPQLPQGTYSTTITLTASTY